MGYPDLIHLMKSPHWFVWILLETALILAAVAARWLFTSAAVSSLFLLIAVLLFVILSFGIVFSSGIREALVRPEAIVEARHRLFLILGGLMAFCTHSS